jgi:hypothetical protein
MRAKGLIARMTKAAEEAAGSGEEADVETSGNNKAVT